MDKDIIRFACEEDSEEILSIYGPYISQTSITFECKIPSLEEFRDRIKSISIDYPYLVYISNDEIIGYAYASRSKTREAYQWNAELSVYIKSSFQHKGIGKVLYIKLMEILKLQNIRNVYGVITTPNEKSENFHQSFGFTKLGVYHNAGYKLGAWRDVVLFEKSIAEYNINPEPFIPISKLDKKKLSEILNN